MAGQNCSNCSAPLTFEAGAEVAQCGYCATTNRLKGLGRIRVKLSGGATGTGGGAAAAVLAISLVVTATVVLGVFFAVRTAPDPTPMDLPPGLRAPAGALTPAALGSTEFIGWTDVAAPPIDGTWEAFDPIANIPWALGVARAWQPDAQLGSIYLHGALADGVLDLRSREGWDVDYRMYSPALRASARELLEVSEEEVRSELRVSVEAGAVTALRSNRHGTLTDPDAPPYEARCTFAEVMTRAVAGGLEPRPTYGAILQHVGEGWRWAVSGKDAGSVIVPVASCQEG